MRKLQAKRLPLLTLALITVLVPGLILITATRRARAATTITVINANDSGAGSLRQAIMDAASGDTINFAGTVTGTITLTSGDMQITKNLTITGPGANLLTVSGNHNSRIFTVTGGTATISGLTLADGNGGSSVTIFGIGGAICNRSTLTLTDCTVTRNTSSVAGGIFNQGTATIHNCTVLNNSANSTGGGLNNKPGSTMTVRDSAIVNNVAPKGGGIYNEETLTLVNTTVANNVGGNGGGLVNAGGLTAINCTITGNRSNTGGGLECSNNEILQNTIIAGNVGLNGVSPNDIFGTVNSVGHCLIGDAGSAGGITDGTGGNIVGVNGAGTRDINTILTSVLGQYGGATPTYLLVCGSPASNAGDNSLSAGLTTDQRGAVRQVGGTVDIGAVEMQNQVTTLTDSGAGSLRDVIAAAAPGTIIDISMCLTGTIALTSGELLIDKDLTINGPGANLLTVARSAADGTPDFRIFEIKANMTVTINGLTIANGSAFAGGRGSEGGGLFTQGMLTLNDCAVSGNSATNGGGLYNSADPSAPTATLTLNRCTVSGNSSSNGGGIVSAGGGIGVTSTLVVNNSTIVGNSASGEGGGIRNDFASGGVGAMTLTNCTITGNSAGQPGTRSISGGGISNNGSADVSPANIGGCIIARNTGVRGTDVVGHFISLGYNLVGDTGGSDGFNQPTDQTGLDPGLELDDSNKPLLKDNGGTTQTVALLCDSPAIDKGKNFTSATTDQRGAGFPRIFNNSPTNAADGTDIGAFELQSYCNHPPVAQCHNVTVSAGADCMASASIDNGSSDPDDGDSITLSQSPAGPYAKGTTTVTLTVTDAHNGSSQCTSTVTVVDNTAPTINCASVAAQSASTNASCSATVPDVTALVRAQSADNCTEPSALVITQSPVAGSMVSGKGSHPITVTVKDADNNSATCTVAFAVNDATAPVITVPANITASAEANQCSAHVTYSASANDTCDGPLTPTCMPPSGSVFSKGATTVTCTASDLSGNPASKSFTVTVNDTQKPVISCPANMLRVTARPGDATGIVNYATPMATDNCGTPNVVCVPPTGAAFPLGTTTVTCTATDTSGNTASCGFTVQMFDVCLQNDGSPTTSVVWNSQTGDYRFCCGGTVYTGRATSNRRGMTFSLSGGTGNRITGSLDATQNKGNASFQAGSSICTITDRDIRDNACQCALSGGGA